MSNFKLHNRFDIEVHNIKTGEVKNYTHYNIVLDRLYNSLFRLSYLTKTQWCSSIVYGEGTGEVDATRTTLFTPIASKSTTNTLWKINPDNMSGKAQYQITIEPNESVGKNISEVGFGTNTHQSTHRIKHINKQESKHHCQHIKREDLVPLKFTENGCYRFRS